MGGYPSVLVGSVSVCHFKINEQTYSRPRLRESTYHLGQKTTLKSKDDTICGLSIDCGNKTLCLINAYLPYYCSANVDGYLQYLSDLRSFCNEVRCPNICVLGDFNASDSNGFCTYLNRFCKENGFILSDNNGYQVQHLPI